MNPIKQLPRLIMDALIIIVTSLGAVFCVTTAFELSVNPIAITVVCTLSALLFTSCFLWKRALWVLLPLAGATILFALITGLFAPVLPTLQQLVHDILNRFSSA